MHYISFDAAWQIYRQAAGVLPSFPERASRRPPERIGGVRDLLDRGLIDAVVLDAYGVLHTGAGLLPEARALNALLLERSVPFCVLTNDVVRPPDRVAAGLRDMGFQIAGNAVLSGLSLLETVLERHHRGAGFALLASEPEALVHRFPGLTPGTFTPASLDNAAGFVLVDSNAWPNAAPGEALSAALIARPRPLIVCNPDVTCPFRGAFSYEPGAVAFPLATAWATMPITFIGKPWDGVYDLVKAHFAAIPPERILAVGDTPQTDVLGGARAGFRTLLVESGLLKGQNAAARCAEAALQPDFIAATV